MTQIFRSITSATRQSARFVRPAPTQVRLLSTSYARFSAAGYGDDPTEGASNSGTKTPASSPNPTKGKQGKQSGTTDPEVSKKSGSKGGKASGKQPGSDKVTHSEDVDPTLKSALGEESGGKAVHDKSSSDRKPGETAQPKETKLPGKPVEKA